MEVSVCECVIIIQEENKMMFNAQLNILSTHPAQCRETNMCLRRPQ